MLLTLNKQPGLEMDVTSKVKTAQTFFVFQNMFIQGFYLGLFCNLADRTRFVSFGMINSLDVISHTFNFI